MTPNDSPITVFTFGAMLIDDKTKTKIVEAGLKFTTEHGYLKWFLLFFVFSIFIIFLWLVYLRKILLEKAT